MKPGSKFLIAAALGAAAGLSQAAQFDFSGDLAFDNSVASFAFTVGSPVGSVVLWTDSAATGLDPVIQLWSMTSPSTGVLLGEVDDEQTRPSQSSFDATLTLPVLTSGSYLITLTSSGNFASFSGLYQDGFSDTTADALPAGATGYSLHFSVAGSGVSITAVPEPASWALMLLGVAGLSLARRSKAAVAGGLV